MKMLQKNLLNLVLAAAMSGLMQVAAADNMYGNTGEPTGDAMMANGLLVRPVMLVGTAVGIVTFVATLPFSILGGNVDEAGKALVVEPAEYTFVRPLGEL